MNHYLIIDEFGSAFHHSGQLTDEQREGNSSGILFIYDITNPAVPVDIETNEIVPTY